MSTLLADQLLPGLEFVQPIKIDRRTNLPHIRVWIYKSGTLVDGDLTLEVLKGSDVLATSEISYQTINAEIAQPYAHGYIRFDFDSLELNVAEGESETDYTLKVSMKNHTKDLVNYISVVRTWEDDLYPVFDIPPNDSVKPAGIELFEARKR